ncbi:MAG: beta-ketoacyl-[acyl-carrier-protein] synthase family protein [Flavobacteriales bacterium]|nr:beta-ketoacyl-[acyl-carrier-protein] synthase family protein [Flavobacteriales bacterium]
MEIAITGIGAISAIGNDVQENLRALLAKETGIGKAQLLSSKLTETHLFGEVKLSNDELRIGLNWTSEAVSRTTLLSAWAMKEAIEQSGITVDNQVGLVSSTSVGGMDRSEGFFEPYYTEQDFANVFMLGTHDCGTCTKQAAAHFGITAYSTTISTACSSAANAIAMGARLLRQGKLKRVIVGGTDALCRFTANGFNSLMILDSEWCKPFSANRAGLNLGEAAAYLVLESREEAEARGAEIHGLVTGWANTNDAYHQTASSPDGNGAFMAMTEALKKAGLNSSDISYINAHGTGTQNNDQSESIAIHRVFGAQKPPISSTKAYTGHTLAAAGAIEAVYSILALKENKLFPNLNYQDPIEDNDWQPQLEVETAEIKHVLSNSFGFGGNNSTVIFSKI